jgi:hypothetical protein
MAASNPSSPSPEQITSHALELWRLAGSPPGGEQPFRAAAEAELRKRAEQTEAVARDPVSRPPERRTR